MAMAGSAPTTFRKAHPDQKIVRLDLDEAHIERAATVLADAAERSLDAATANVLLHVADRLRKAQ